MKLPYRSTLAAAASLAVLGAFPSRPGSVVIATAYARNDGLRSYTFHMDVAMAMRHFPWLHFHVEGDGVYQRGEKYVVHFTKMPFFAKSIHDIDLSLIDPRMWTDKYRYYEIGQQNGDTLFALEPLDAKDTLKNATVAISPSSGAQWIDASYADGTHIHMNVDSTDSTGYLLPDKLTASVDYPSMPLSANAQFDDYAFLGMQR